MGEVDQTWINATRFFAHKYAGNWATQCTECGVWVYFEYNASASVFDNLAVHLQESHQEMLEGLIKDYTSIWPSKKTPAQKEEERGEEGI